MSVVISYLAQVGDDLQDGHAVNAQYDITTKYSSFNAVTPKPVRKDQKALTGRMVSIIHRSERQYTFSLKNASVDTLPDWKEFRDSTRAGASATFSIDATAVVGIQEVIEGLVMTTPPSFVLSRSRKHFSINFKCYRQPE